MAGSPEKGLADGKEAKESRVGRLSGCEGAPGGGVVGAPVGAGGEEEGGATAGELLEERAIGGEGPGVAVGDVRCVAGDGGAEAGAVLEFVVPDGLEAGGKEVGGPGEEIEVEEGVGVWA